MDVIKAAACIELLHAFVAVLLSDVTSCSFRYGPSLYNNVFYYFYLFIPMQSRIARIPTGANYFTVG